MKKTLIWGLLGLSVVTLFIRFGIAPLWQVIGINPKAGVKVTSIPVAEVFINDKALGNTPFETEELESGEYKVKLVSDKDSWQGWVKLNKGAVTVVNRELAQNIASSSGEILILDRGRGVYVTSSPSGAEVEVDGKLSGQTPLYIADVLAGEHSFLLSKEGYLKRSIRASLPENMSLSLSVDLAITEIDLTGSLPPTAIPEPLEAIGVVKQTPNGFLRVRKSPSLSAAEVSRVSSGDSVTILEEKVGWMKVRLENGKEGYVSTTYIQK